MGKDSSENAGVVEQIGKSICSIFKWFKDMYEQDRENNERLRKLYMQQQLEDRIFQHMYQIQLELFEVFQHNRYPRLLPVQVPEHIRPDGYVYSKDMQGYLYYFCIDKSSFDELAEIVCDSIRKRMDDNIFSFKRRLSYSMPDVQMSYPNMMYGICIVNLENRLDCVRITVVTVISP